MFAKRSLSLRRVILFSIPILLLCLFDLHLTYFLLPDTQGIASVERVSQHLALLNNVTDIPDNVRKYLYGARYVERNLEELSPCLPFLVYDKPPKTGSTAVTQALKGLLRRKLKWRDINIAVCDRKTCADMMDQVCETGRNRVHMLQHVSGKEGRIECLKRRGYYAVTSIREPGERWRSAFRYNRMVKGNHFGVAWNESYQTFMKHVPRCKMLWYYDGLDELCTDESIVQDRIQSIVARYDEIIQLGVNQEKGQVESILGDFVRDVNVSPKTKEGQDVEYQRIKFEVQLYDAFQQRRKQLIQNPTRAFCAPQI